jgi:hypothetical protein
VISTGPSGASAGVTPGCGDAAPAVAARVALPEGVNTAAIVAVPAAAVPGVTGGRVALGAAPVGLAATAVAGGRVALGGAPVGGGVAAGAVALGGGGSVAGGGWVDGGGSVGGCVGGGSVGGVVGGGAVTGGVSVGTVWRQGDWLGVAQPGATSASAVASASATATSHSFRSGIPILPTTAAGLRLLQAEPQMNTDAHGLALDACERG